MVLNVQIEDVEFEVSAEDGWEIRPGISNARNHWLYVGVRAVARFWFDEQNRLLVDYPSIMYYDICFDGVSLLSMERPLVLPNKFTLTIEGLVVLITK